MRPIHHELPLTDLAHSMAAAVDDGDRTTAVHILDRVERTVGHEPTDHDEPLVVLARRFSAAHRALVAIEVCPAV